ncbi:MAG: hypothetical protein ACODAG_04280 [Myxococcota bacterium]
MNPVDTVLELAGRAAVSASAWDALPSGWRIGLRTAGGLIGGVAEALKRRSPDEVVALLRRLADEELPSARETAEEQDAEIEAMIRRRWPEG